MKMQTFITMCSFVLLIHIVSCQKVMPDTMITQFKRLSAKLTSQYLHSMRCASTCAEDSHCSGYMRNGQHGCIKITDGRANADVCSSYPVPDVCYIKLQTKTSVMQPEPTEAALFVTAPNDSPMAPIHSATPVDDSLTSADDSLTPADDSLTPADDSTTSAADSAVATTDLMLNIGSVTPAAQFATSGLEPTTGATASPQGCVEAIWYDSYRDKLLMSFTGSSIVSLYPKDPDSIVQNISTSQTTRHAYCTSLPGGVNDIYFVQTYSMAYYMVLESE